jgi:antibiotic biosynthesis monooxygenase (ABM) superfamily enzyme
VWQALIVGLIVLAAAAYAVWALLPAALRLRLAQGIGAWGRKPGRAAWLTRASTAVERAARARMGGCSDCSAVQAAPTPPSDRAKH